MANMRDGSGSAYNGKVIVRQNLGSLLLLLWILLLIVNQTLEYRPEPMNPYLLPLDVAAPSWKLLGEERLIALLLECLCIWFRRRHLDCLLNRIDNELSWKRCASVPL